MKLLPILSANLLLLFSSQFASAGVKQGASASSAADIELKVKSDVMFVTVCAPDMIHFDLRPNGKASPNTVCIAQTKWPKVVSRFTVSGGITTVSTAKMLVKIEQATGLISVYKPKEGLLLKENSATPGKLSLTGAEGSHFYGIHGYEFLQKAGNQVELAPRAEPYRIGAGSEGNTGGPFVWSTKGYGIYLDTAGGQCAVPVAGKLEFTNISKANVDFYVMVGDAYAIHTDLDKLTGLPPMFPKWALGLFNSEFAGIHEKDMREIVDGYRSRGIPFDTYVHDFDWKDWSGDNYGEWKWNPVKFPSGPSGQLKKDMDAKGIKMVGIMKPRIHVDTVQGHYATDHNFWVKRPFYEDYFDHGKVGDIDFSIPAARTWFWDHSEGAFDKGIVGWWNDEADAWGDDFEFLYMAQSQYEGQRKYTHDQNRVYTINRNFYSGSQRYAYATWSGDIESGFGVMQDQRARLLDSLNIGQMKWGMDTGGFNNNAHIRGEEASEAYARWMEFDVFAPIFRLHGTSRRQPWIYGPTAEAAATKAIKLRYSFLPYLYSYDHLLTETGIGICRPLTWDYPNDPNVVNDVDAWMFGDYLLAAPVVDHQQSLKSIYLPEGQWYAYFRGRSYRGGQTIEYPVNNKTWDDIPLFVKAGAIIPTADVPNYVGEKPITSVSVDIFPSQNETSFDYYDDDGITYNYEKGKYFLQKISQVDTAGSYRITLSRRIGTYTPDLKWYLLKVHGHPSSVVSVGGKRLKKSSSYKALFSSSSGGWATGQDVFGDVTFIRVKPGQALKIDSENK